MHAFLKSTDMSTTGKVITWTSVIAVLALAAFIFIKFCFVYSEGVNEGDINYLFPERGFSLQDLRGQDDPDGSEEYQGTRLHPVERVQVLGRGRASGKAAERRRQHRCEASLETLPRHFALARKQPVYRR